MHLSLELIHPQTVLETPQVFICPSSFKKTRCINASPSKLLNEFLFYINLIKEEEYVTSLKSVLYLYDSQKQNYKNTINAISAKVIISKTCCLSDYHYYLGSCILTLVIQVER